MAELTAQLTFRVTVGIYERLQTIAGEERRKMNEVARALLERGLSAYAGDGRLFESEPKGKGAHPQTADERELLVFFRRLSKEDRAELKRVIEGLKSAAENDKETPKGKSKAS
jgi:hypothetical protein